MKGFLFFIILKTYFLIIYCEDPHSFLDMYWEKIGDCLDAEQRLIDISEIKIKKLSRTLIGITGQVLVKKTIKEGFTVEVVATRKALTGRWVPVDIQDITSKRHDGCELISVEKYYVGPVLKSAHIPPKCPIQEGTYTLVNDTMAFNLPRFIIPTCYKLEVKLFDTEENVFMCGAAVIKIVPTGEGPFPKCI